MSDDEPSPPPPGPPPDPSDAVVPPPVGPPPWEEPAPPPPPQPAPAPAATAAAAPTSRSPAPPAGGSLGVLVARVVAIVIVLGLVAGAAYLALEETDDSEQAAGEIYLEASDAPGPNPFMPSVATIDEAATTITPSSSDAPTTTADSQTGIDTGRAVGALLLSLIDAETPGLYGGTRDETSCNVLQMAAFLDGDDAKRAAWAQVQGIATDAVNAYLRELTPVNLRVDTRVTNHGFSNGTATPRNAILQAGTAVLVDELGVPRAKCGCGNPLTPPTEVQGTPAFQGQPWPTFDPHDVKVVQPAPAPVDEFVLVDPGGAPFARPAATTGADDQDAPPEMLQTVTTALDPPPPPPTTTGGGDIGTPTTPRAVSASTVYSDEFPASLAVDGDPTTSWFSAGPGADGTTTFTWEAPAPGRVIGVQIVSNAQHENPEFRTGFGFESVEVQILDESGEVVFSNPVALPGTPDPLITIRPDFEGAAVRLVFGGHEDPACGGIADLFVVMG